MKLKEKCLGTEVCVCHRCCQPIIGTLPEQVPGEARYYNLSPLSIDTSTGQLCWTDQGLTVTVQGVMTILEVPNNKKHLDFLLEQMREPEPSNFFLSAQVIFYGRIL